MGGMGAMAGIMPGAMGPMWNANAICDGKRAEERAQWLVQNNGMSWDAAHQQVMREFPAQFGGHGAMPGMGGFGGMPAMGGFGGAVCMPAMGGPQRCFKCDGSGWFHDSTMPHDKGPREKCFFCKKCKGCNGSGTAGGSGAGFQQRCFKCEGKGFCHESSMTHDKAPHQKCFFCKDCSSCHGKGTM